MHDTHLKGVIGELEFSSHLMKKGYSVLVPLNPNSSYDLVFEKENIFTRVQVKYCTPKNGILRIELDRHKKNIKPYKEREVDAMGAYDAVHHRFYLIPVQEIKSKKEIWLRVEDSRGRQKKNIHIAEKFEL